jgi:hypothetical protein
MAISKFDKFVNKDWSWTTPITKLPELDFAGFNEVLNQQQSQIDQVGLLSSKRPNVLNNQADLELYQGYQKDVDTALDTVSKEYGKGITAGNMAYKNYLNQFRKDWSPGGRADILNKRNEAYNSGIAAIDKFYADDTSPVNKTLAKRQLQEQLSKPINVDPSTGQFTNFSQPELYKNPDVNKAIDEMLKEIKANGNTTFLGDTNKDWWIQKIQSETREPERIKLAYQALASQPEYAAQIQRDADYKAMTIDPATHQAAYENTLNTNLANLTQTAEDAKKDKQSTIDWQNTLRQQGYNVKADGDFEALTEKATKEFLDSQKQSVADGLLKYNFKNQMISEVDKGYLGYALRGAYQKIDNDHFFNQAKKAMVDASLKQEENSINMWRAQMEFAPKDQSSVTVVSGIAQKLPEIQTYHQDLKKQLGDVEKNVDKALSNSTTFRGWTKENVAEAYNTWNKVTGNTPEERKANYKALLAQKSDYPFTDQQVDEIFKEMNGAGDGVIKTSLRSLGQLQSEVHRVEEGQAAIAKQYIATPEGQADIAELRRNAPSGYKYLSDAELAAKAVSDPASFTSDKDSMSKSLSPGNAAKNFSYNMEKNVPKQEKNGTKYNWGSLGTFELYANNNDKTLKPTLDGIGQAIETGTGQNFSSFGQAGLVYKNKDGEKVDPGKSRKVQTMTPTVTLDGRPVIRVGMSITGERGGSYAGFTDIDVVPGSVENIQLLTGAKKAYAEKLKNEGPEAAQGILHVIEALEGKNHIDRGAMDIQVNNLNLNNTSPEPIYVSELDPITGQPKLIDVRTLGWQAKNLEKDENINGYGYGLYGFSTYTGPAVGNVFQDEEGRKILSQPVGQPGVFVFGSADAALKDRLAKSILANTPVEVTETKVHTNGQTSRKTEITKTTKSE